MAEHFNEAATALHAVGDSAPRPRALAVGQQPRPTGRYDEAHDGAASGGAAGERVQADDVLAIACGNQANVAMIRHRYEQALTLAERAVARTSSIRRATAWRCRSARSVRSPSAWVIWREPQRRSIRRSPSARRCSIPRDDRRDLRLARADAPDSRRLRRAGRGAGPAPRRLRRVRPHTPRWYDWSLRLFDARLTPVAATLARAVHAADTDSRVAGRAAVRRAARASHRRRRPVQAERFGEAQQRLELTAAHVDPRMTPGAWGEFLRVRGMVAAATGRATEGYHDLSQSATVGELLGERYQSALSQLALGRVAARAGARSLAVRHLDQAFLVFTQLGAARDRARRGDGARAAGAAGVGRVRQLAGRCRRCSSCAGSSTPRRFPSFSDGKPRRRCWRPRPATPRCCSSSSPATTCGVVATAGCDADTARALARAFLRATLRPRRGRRRAARPRSRGPISGAARLAASDRPPGHAAAAHDRQRGPARLCAVRGARSPGGPDRPARSSARSNRSSPGSSRPAPP